MNETIASSPYDIIVQQQIDIVAKCQKDYLEGKDNPLQLIEAVNLLVSIKGCIPLQSPILGAVGVSRAFDRAFDYSSR